MTLPWKKLDELLRNPRVEGKEFIEKEVFDRLVPSCPDCKTPLIYRLPHERFMEDDNYVQCVNGHVFELVPPPDGHFSAKEIISSIYDCDHEWVDPSNEAVEAGEYRLCLKCHRFEIPKE